MCVIVDKIKLSTFLYQKRINTNVMDLIEVSGQPSEKSKWIWQKGGLHCMRALEQVHDHLSICKFNKLQMDAPVEQMLTAISYEQDALQRDSNMG